MPEPYLLSELSARTRYPARLILQVARQYLGRDPDAGTPLIAEAAQSCFVVREDYVNAAMHSGVSGPGEFWYDQEILCVRFVHSGDLKSDAAAR